jgi:uncharacterized membrane protein
MTNPLYILGVLCVIVAVSEWLVRNTVLRHAGTALLGILLTAVVANIGIIPAGSSLEAPVPVYDAIFAYVAPLAIFWLILNVNLKDVLRAGLPLVALFCIGALATVAGVMAGMAVVDGAHSIGPNYNALGGMFAGTYIGGSINFNAVALEYDIVREGVLYAGSIAVDNVVTTVWMVATLALPRLLAPFWPKARGGSHPRAGVLLGIEDDTESLHPIDLGLMLAIGLFSIVISDIASTWLGARGIGIPFMLVLTIIALVLAQVPFIARLRGARVIGMFAVYLFLNVIGAFCDIGTLTELGRLGVTLLVFASITVLVHGVITFGAARLMGLDLDTAAVASQANVGGGTSALALARSLGRGDLVLPAVLIGSLGNALGNFLGFWVAGSLL